MAEVCRLTEMGLDLNDGAFEQADVWLRAADVRITHLGDLENGFDNLVSALQEQPGHEEVRQRLSPWVLRPKSGVGCVKVCRW